MQTTNAEVLMRATNRLRRPREDAFATSLIEEIRRKHESAKTGVVYTTIRSKIADAGVELLKNPALGSRVLLERAIKEGLETCIMLGISKKISSQVLKSMGLEAYDS